MSIEARKRNAASRKKRNTGLRMDVLEAIERLFPDGIVELSFDSEESYHWDLHPKLIRAFWRIRNTRVLHEREADGGPVWSGESDLESDPPDDIEPSRSYYMFFLSPADEAFASKTETEDLAEPEFITGEFEEAGWGDDPPAIKIPGKCWTGWQVAVSALAPFAVISIGDLEIFENGNVTEPRMDSGTETEEQFRRFLGDRRFAVLLKLHGVIEGILRRQGIAVLPSEEWRKPVAWLRGGEDCFAEVEGEALRVLDAFFFEQM